MKAIKQQLYGCATALSTTISKTKHELNFYDNMDELSLKKACGLSICHFGGREWTLKMNADCPFKIVSITLG